MSPKRAKIQAFATNAVLARHMLIIRHYTNIDLTWHLQSEMNTKSFKSDVCGKAFVEQSNPKEHPNTHAG